MKFAVVGVGGVGGYFGGQLAQSGHQVSFIARGEHLRAMQNDGLFVDTPEGSFHLPDVSATDKPHEIGVVDCVIVAVKGWQIQQAAESIKPLMGTNTLVLPLLNGVQATDELSRLLDSPHVLNGLCGIIAEISAPGRIQHIAIDPYIKLGETGNTTSRQTLNLKTALDDTGAAVEIPDDIQREVWLKYIFIAPLSGVTAVTRATPGVIRSIPETRKMLHSAIAESIEVGKALGVALTEEDLTSTIKLIDAIPPDGTTSMQRDVEAGFPSELETQTGAIVGLARQVNVPVPVNTFIYAALLPQENLARTD